MPELSEVVSLRKAEKLSSVPYSTLKAAAQRWQRTDGKKGLKSVLLEDGRDYITTMDDVDRFKRTEYRPRKVRCEK